MSLVVSSFTAFFRVPVIESAVLVMVTTLPAFTSVLLPKRPCPYSDARPGFAVATALASAARGMLHVNDACCGVGWCRGSPSGPRTYRAPGLGELT